MRDDIPDRLLERYCAGDCAPSERSEVERWIAADPAHRELVALLTAAWHEAGVAAVPAERADVPAMWARVRTRVQETTHPPLRIAAANESPRSDRRFGLTRRFGRGAAAAALVLAAGATLLVTHLANDSAITTSSMSQPMQEIVTRRGQRVALDLPDGSRVVVAPESRLRIPKSYRPAVGAREVFLEGEAYFEVQHDDVRRFRVYAASGIAEDLGTEFVVTAYPEMDGVQVVVAEGAVALRSANTTSQAHAFTLMPGQLGKLDATGTRTQIHSVAVAPYVAWTTGKLVFKGTPMREVVPRLARWYDLDIRLADSSIAERRFTSVFQDETAQQVLEAVSLSLGLRSEMVGRRVVLSKAE